HRRAALLAGHDPTRGDERGSAGGQDGPRRRSVRRSGQRTGSSVMIRWRRVLRALLALSQKTRSLQMEVQRLSARLEAFEKIHRALSVLELVPVTTPAGELAVEILSMLTDDQRRELARWLSERAREWLVPGFPNSGKAMN